MKKTLMKAITAVILVGGSLTITTPAHATRVSADGGTWDYGVAGYPGTTWSYYYHASKVHRSTACNTSWCSRSADAGRGSWSRVAVQASLNNNRAYYYNY